MSKNFVSTRRGNPCELCGDTKGKCRTTPSTSLCMSFAEASDRIPGFKFIGRTKDDLWGKWLIDDGHTWTPQQRDQWRQERDAQCQLRQQQEQQRHAAALPLPERDRHYRTLLSQLTLHPLDRADLHRRGLTNKQIEASGFQSVEQWQRLEIELPHTLPGVSLDGRSLNTQAGYLCPIWDVDRQLVGFQVRLRTAEQGGRYRWLSSRTQKRPQGATPHLPNGELPLAVFRPLQLKRSGIALVEGTGAKPLITCDRLGIATIGAAGGQFASSPQTLKTTLEQLSAELGTRAIEFYPDAGAIVNKTVLRQYQSTWKLLQRWGYDVSIGWWGQFAKDAPDIDELADTSAIELISIRQLEAIERNKRKGFSRLIALLSQRPEPQQQPEQRQAAKPISAQEYAVGDRLDTWQRAIEQGYRHILDLSSTGTGKSFDAGTIEPRTFGAKQALYLSPQHRNPTVETLSVENGWVDLEARHAGLSSESTPGGGQRLKRTSKGEIPSIPANCNRTGIIGALRAKHVQGADTASVVCGTCPLKEACQNASGSGYGFLNQRRSALSSPKLRSHPDSLPDPTDYPLDESMLLWDEAGENFTVKHDVVVTMQDLQQTIATLLKAGLFEPLQALLTALLPHLDGTAKTGRYGLNHADVVKLLGNVEAIDVAAVERALQPDLGFLNTTAEYGVELADLPSSLRKKFADRDRDGAALAEQQVVKQWLPDLLRILQGASGALHLDRQTLTISLPDARHRSIVQAAKATVFLDATLSREDLALKLGCQPEEIYICRQKLPDTDNLTITQVTDLGRLGMQRGKDQQRRATAIASHYQQLDPTAKAIDFKRLADKGVGAWWRDSRGVNDFEQTKTLILIGTPCRNLADLQAEYSILTGCHDAENTHFKAFVDRVITADIHQAIGRLRAHRRPDEQLQAILLTDFVLDIRVNQVSAADITPDAADKSQRIIIAARRAIEHLKLAGQKLTQAAIAAIVGCTQGRISQLWEFINFAIEDTNSKIYNSTASPPDPDLVQTLETVATEGSTVELLESLPELFFDWFTPPQWQQVWQQLSGKAQTKLLEAVILTLPEPQIEQMNRAIES